MIFKLTKKKINNEEIIKEVYNSKKLKRYIYFFIGVLICALSFNIFMKENHIISGVSGLSIITEKYFNIQPWIVILIGNVLLLIASYFLLGKEKTKGSILGSLLFPLLIKLTDNVSNYIDLGNTEMIVLVLAGAVLSGFVPGLIFKNNFTSGGSDILKQIMTVYFKVPFSKANLYSEGVIVTLGAIAFGWQSFLYSIITLAIVGYVSDRVILGISEYKTMEIITDKEESIKDFILNKLNHGVTVINAEGGFTNRHKKVLISAIPTREYFLATESIRKIDPEAFIITMDTYELSSKKPEEE